MRQLYWPTFGRVAAPSLTVLHATRLSFCRPLGIPTIKSIIDNPEIFENMGFSEPEEVAGSPAALGTPCLTFNFVADEDADVMGTQVRP